MRPCRFISDRLLPDMVTTLKSAITPRPHPSDLPGGMGAGNSSIFCRPFRVSVEKCHYSGWNHLLAPSLENRQIFLIPPAFHTSVSIPIPAFDRECKSHLEKVNTKTDNWGLSLVSGHKGRSLAQATNMMRRKKNPVSLLLASPSSHLIQSVTSVSLPHDRSSCCSCFPKEAPIDTDWR